MKFYTFGLNESPNHPGMTGADAPSVLGGKGAGLVWMSQQGMPVPPGFIIPTTVWAEWDKKPKTILKEIAKSLPEYLKQLKTHFGYMPLLSVRSGSRVSCPGMMDTLLNVGIDDKTQDLWKDRLGLETYSDSLHRLVTMYGSVVKGLDRAVLGKNLSTALKTYNEAAGDFPDAFNQVMGAIEAVFKSWDNDRAIKYRKLNSIPREYGTAVTVQAMVFGNLNDQSGTGVLFTRDTNTGDKGIIGEFLPKAQGEDIVAGIRTPMPLADMLKWNPELLYELQDKVKLLEKLKKDVQDVEFTIQDGKLYLLQTRNAKRSAVAALRIAVDMAKEKLITEKEAVSRVSAKQFDQVQQPTIDPAFKKTEAFKGIAACMGIVSGKPVFTKEDAISCKVPCILIREETTPDDIAGMYAAKGLLTMTGGLTCHAAVVARGMDKACVVGLGKSVEDFKEVEVVSMDGATGRVWLEGVPVVSVEPHGLVAEYGAMMAKVFGSVPVLHYPITPKLSEALLFVGYRMADTTKAVKLVVDTAKNVDRLYVDLTIEDLKNPHSMMVNAEADFMSMVTAFEPAQKLVNELQWLADDLGWLKDRLVIIGDVTTTFKMLGNGQDLRSIILADGEMILGEVNVSDPAIKKVLEWRKGENLSLVSLGKPVEGVKSMLSMSQMLQLVAKG